MFIDAYLALISAAGPGSCVEVTTPGYARQAIAFSVPTDGVSMSSIPYGFGMLRTGAIGRAIYDAPTGGNLLLVLPFPTPLSTWRPLWDGGDVGVIRLVFTVMAGIHRGAAYTGRLAAGTEMGTCSDLYDIGGPTDVSQGLGNPRLAIATATMTAGVALSIARGTLTAASNVPAGVE